MSKSKLIKKKTIENYLKKVFSEKELEYYLQFEDFSAFLAKMQNEESFDSDLTQQLFEKMKESHNTPKPTMRAFSATYIEAIGSLDKKIDLQDQQIRGLEEKLVYLDQTIQSLKSLKRKNKLPFKKQVHSITANNRSLCSELSSSRDLSRKTQYSN